MRTAPSRMPLFWRTVCWLLERAGRERGGLCEFLIRAPNGATDLCGGPPNLPSPKTTLSCPVKHRWNRACRTTTTSSPSSLHRGLPGHQHNLPSPVPAQRPAAPAALAQQAAPSAVAGGPAPDALPPQRLRQVPHQAQDVERVVPGRTLREGEETLLPRPCQVSRLPPGPATRASPFGEVLTKQSLGKRRIRGFLVNTT